MEFESAARVLQRHARRWLVSRRCELSQRGGLARPRSTSALAEQEKERQRRAQAFLERELRAKERAEAALRQLQREKQQRMRLLAEQRELRARRMGNVPQAGGQPDWERRLQAAQQMHAERRRAQGMVAGDHRPRPPPKSRLQDAAAPAPDAARAAALNILAAANGQQEARRAAPRRAAPEGQGADPNNPGAPAPPRRAEDNKENAENAVQVRAEVGLEKEKKERMREENERLRG